MKNYFITYSDSKYGPIAERLLQQARETGWYYSIVGFSPRDLPLDFSVMYSDILMEKRGAGYWIWKPLVISSVLERMEKNDLLFYCDAGCSINPLGFKRFAEYIEILDSTSCGIVSFQLEHKEVLWTTREIFHYFGVHPFSLIAHSGQIMATTLIIQNNDLARFIFREAVKILRIDPYLFTDRYNKDQAGYFIDNRHDQSILSVLRKKYCDFFLPDETFFEQYGVGRSLSYPFWATRIRPRN